MSSEGDITAVLFIIASPANGIEWNIPPSISPVKFKFYHQRIKPFHNKPSPRASPGAFCRRPTHGKKKRAERRTALEKINSAKSCKSLCLPAKPRSLTHLHWDCSERLERRRRRGHYCAEQQSAFCRPLSVLLSSSLPVRADSVPQLWYLLMLRAVRVGW